MGVCTLKKFLILDMDRCTGCEACVVSCSISKEGIFDPTRSRIQVFRDESEGLAIPFVCEQCEEPPCVEACPVNALEKDVEIGVVRVNSKLCTGCGLCVEACLYNGVRLNPKSNVAIICDLCGGEPLCAKVCVPTKAITCVDYSDETFREKMKDTKKRMTTFKSIKEDFGGTEHVC